MARTRAIWGTLLLLLGGCGAGSLEGLPSGPTLEIATSRLPAARRDLAYEPTQLVATGARGPVLWTVVDGCLPAGLLLTDGGVLRGEAREEGVFTFAVEATDGTAEDRTAFDLAVDTFALAASGLFVGEAWTGEPVTLRAIGATGPVTFTVGSNGSGGAFDRIDADAGRAAWVAGEASQPTTDRIVATDVASGVVAELTLAVVPHPAPHHVAWFGATDVWYVDFNRRFGAHGLPTDWEATLSRLGLRSAGRTAGEADRLADLYVRRAVLESLNRLFGRAADGSGGGAPISFPLARPGAGYTAPGAGSWAAPTPSRYNVIAVIDGSVPGVVGLGFVDAPTNGLIENDTTSGGVGELGVFANQVAQTFNAAWQNESLPADPVGEGDLATLRAMVYGGVLEGERATRIRRMADGFAQALAGVLAHEIGHALGLQHNDYESGSLMNAGASIHPWATLGFTDAHREQIARALPGPGRRTGTGGAAPAVPAGGVAACRLCVGD